MTVADNKKTLKKLGISIIIEIITVFLIYIGVIIWYTSFYINDSGVILDILYTNEHNSKAIIKFMYPLNEKEGDSEKEFTQWSDNYEIDQYPFDLIKNNTFDIWYHNQKYYFDDPTYIDIFFITIVSMILTMALMTVTLRCASLYIRIQN